RSPRRPPPWCPPDRPGGRSCCSRARQPTPAARNHPMTCSALPCLTAVDARYDRNDATPAHRVRPARRTTRHVGPIRLVAPPTPSPVTDLRHDHVWFGGVWSTKIGDKSRPATIRGRAFSGKDGREPEPGQGSGVESG